MWTEASTVAAVTVRRPLDLRLAISVDQRPSKVVEICSPSNTMIYSSEP